MLSFSCRNRSNARIWVTLCLAILTAAPIPGLAAIQAAQLDAKSESTSVVDDAANPLSADSNSEVQESGEQFQSGTEQSTESDSPTDTSATDTSSVKTSGEEDAEEDSVAAANDNGEVTPLGSSRGETDNASTAPGNAAETGQENAGVELETSNAGETENGDKNDNAEFGPKSESESPSMWLNFQTLTLVGVVLAILGIASIVASYLTRQSAESVNPALVRRFRQRLNAWWFMCAILAFGLLLNSIGTVVLFGLVSFWALREFITMAPTRRGDHRALFWALIVFTPLQYLLIGLERAGFTWWRNGEPVDFYGLYSIVIPVYASLYIPARIAISGDHKRFLERSAQITFGLLICVYSLSYAPALVNLQLTDSQGNAWAGSPAGLLFYFVLMSQLSDILQWTWGHWVGQKYIAEEVSSGRTWEGFVGGTLSTGLVGAALYWVTPFTFYESALMSMAISVMGMYGGMAMSAIKRDRGVNDYGSLVLGHAGVLDRIDTICFAAPVFYHLTRFFFS
ncbi:MAG: phosphatidate cytidylyltransferase [Planctomycetota bacterium]